jgi:hypothetical protein
MKLLAFFILLLNYKIVVGGQIILPSENDLQGCFSQNLFPVYNETSGLFDCHELTQQGPCNDGEILLLKDLSIAHCVPRPCPDEDFVLYKVIEFQRLA